MVLLPKVLHSRRRAPHCGGWSRRGMLPPPCLSLVAVTGSTPRCPDALMHRDRRRHRRPWTQRGQPAAGRPGVPRPDPCLGPAQCHAGAQRPQAGLDMERGHLPPDPAVRHSKAGGGGQHRRCEPHQARGECRLAPRMSGRGRGLKGGRRGGCCRRSGAAPWRWQPVEACTSTCLSHIPREVGEGGRNGDQQGCSRC